MAGEMFTSGFHSWVINLAFMSPGQCGSLGKPFSHVTVLTYPKKLLPGPLLFAAIARDFFVPV